MAWFQPASQPARSLATAVATATFIASVPAFAAPDPVVPILDGAVYTQNQYPIHSTTWQYQSFAAPVTVPEPAVAIDWFVQSTGPPHHLVPRAPIDGAQYFAAPDPSVPILDGAVYTQQQYPIFVTQWQYQSVVEPVLVQPAPDMDFSLPSYGFPTLYQHQYQASASPVTVPEGPLIRSEELVTEDV